MDYRLDHQVGFLLRRAFQRHTVIFNEQMLEGLTSTQFAAIAKLHEIGPLSQNHLGRETAMDAATIKGVVDRLTARGFVGVAEDLNDQRRLTVSLTPKGQRVAKRCIQVAARITDATLAPLTPQDRSTLLKLLSTIADGE